MAIQDPIIQKFAVRFAGGYLSEKTGADIKVGRIAVSPDLRLFVDDVTVKDLKGNDLAKIGRLRAKAFVGELLEGKVHFQNIELADTEANLITYEGEERMNFSFLLDAFPSDTTKEKESKPVPIMIDQISLKNVDFMLWNQNKSDSLKTANHLMDYAHLDLDDINLEATDFYMLGDSIHANIGSLTASELSGLLLKGFSSDATVTSNGIFLKDMQMETNNSRFDLDLNMLYHGFDDFNSFVDSVVFDATIRPTDVMLSDIGVFTDVMYKMPDRVKFEGRFTGPIEHFRVDDIKAELGKSTSFQGSISMHPLDFENGYHTLNIKDMRFNYDDLANFYIPSSTKTIPMPESLKPMGDSRLSLDFKGSYNDFDSYIKLNSDIGDVETSIARAKDAQGTNVFSGYINADRVKAGTIANATKYVGDLDLATDFTVKFPQQGNPELSLDGTATKVQLLGKTVDQIKLDGSMEQNLFKGIVKVYDDELGFDFNGLIDFQDTKYPKSDFKAVVRNADLSALNLMKGDSISRISTTIYANMTGFNIDDLEGTLRLDSTLYHDSRGTYYMKDFAASIVDDNLMQRRINLDCDFFDFEMAGQMNFASMVPVFKEYINHYMTIPQWDEELAALDKSRKKKDLDQDFIVNLNLKDTKTLSRLLMPSLQIAKNTSLSGTFTSRTHTLNLIMRSKNIKFGEVNFNGLELRNFNMANAAFTSLKLDEISYNNISETDTLHIGLENLAINTRMTNDTVFANINWDDRSLTDHNTASIATYFHPDEEGSIFSITEANILVNDSLWSVSPNNFIILNDDRNEISNLMFSHNDQSIRIDGFVPKNVGDTLGVQLRDFDISNFDFFFLTKGFDVDGLISGDAMVSGLNAQPMLLANLDIKELGVDGESIGDAVINSSWNNAEKSVDLDVSILDQMKKSLNVYGSYFTERKSDNLDFTVEMDSLRLVALSPFLAGVVSRLQGYGNGKATVTGSLDRPNIEGSISINDGGCKVGYLNTFYTFEPTILIDNHTIKFENLVLVDTVGNKAMVDGQINHNMLKDFYLNLKLHPRDFLALATTSKDNDTFYGSAVANGLIEVKGPLNDIFLDIKASTRKGTHLTIPLNRTATVSDNDFVVFVSREEEPAEEEKPSEKKEDKKTNFTLNLDVNATDDATMKILLPSDIGTIEASGNGALKLGTSSTDPFTMYGNYTIESGKFQLSLYNLVTRFFNLKRGGTITWTGDPTDGRINATGAYSVKTSLAGLGVEVDSTVNNNVNVECLIHLKGALLNPTITFGMNLPNASEDIAQTVFTLVDTTNQAAMTQQALSLLVVGSFAYVGGGYGNLNLSNIFSGGMQLDITDNLNLGLHYNSGSVNTYDEYMMSLCTELFENRLTIETNFGVMSSNNPATNASNLVGEFDLYYKLQPDGRLMAHFYNHSNYNSNLNVFALDRRSPYTQGLGLSYSRSFDKFRNLFRKQNSFNGQPMIRPRKPTTDDEK
ncbi:MAG: translocation/assembly module TamB domain-containing protein [Bacteroidales bacterium]|nr:translocation/assembly module TamB domain-containing protein [Bacteroidales bacterium]